MARNTLSNMIATELGYIWGLTVQKPLKHICFTGDDGYKTDYSLIKPLCNELDFPYTFAIQCNAIGGSAYMNETELRECAEDSHIKFAVHCMDDTRMDSVTPDELNEIYDSWYSWMRTRGFIGVSEICPIMYNHGNATDVGIAETVRFRTFAGCTTTKGINNVPFERFRMRRNGLFPSDSSYTIEMAKADIDRVSENGGLIVFMTHSNTATFSIDGIRELVNYARNKGVEIGDLAEIVNEYDPYTIPPRPSYTWERVETELFNGVARLSAWNADNPATVQNPGGSNSILRLTKPIDVSGMKKLKITGYTSNYFCKYAFYSGEVDTNGFPKTYPPITFSHFDTIVSGSKGNFTSVIVDVPTGARWLYVSGTDGTTEGRNPVEVYNSIN